MIQEVVGRLATCSFQLKGWVVTLTAGLVVFLKREANPIYLLLPALPVIAFWLLDEWYLRQERLFRRLFDDVRCKEGVPDFSMDTLRRYIRGADSLCRWLDGQGVAVVEVNQGHVERYVRQHTRLPDIHYAAQGRLCKATVSVPFIATVLREQGSLSGSAPVSNADAWLARFDNHLMRVHGLALESRHHYLRYTRRLIQSLQMSESDWTALNAEQIRDFICCEAGNAKPVVDQY